MSSASSIVQILWRYKNHEDLSEEELSALRKWLDESSDHEDLFDDLSNTAKWDMDIAPLLAKDGNATWNKIKNRVENFSDRGIPVKRKSPPQLQRLAYAAAAALVLIIGTVLFSILKRDRDSEKPTVENHRVKNEIFPANDHVTLKLDNGKVIRLDSARTGEIALEGGTRISMHDSAGIAYQGHTSENQAARYNTLITGKGKMFQLLLPDGTAVWMNACSSLRYPVSFDGADRPVELSGEAYFEVAKNKEKPFIVRTAYSRLRVLGTHFNVKAYGEEKDVRTTLLEGLIWAGNAGDSVMMRPGQQIRITDHGRVQIDSANLQQALAWKNKLFWFQQTPIREIMAQIGRQYDITIHYDTRLNPTFTGVIPENLPLTRLLNMLEQGGNVHFVLDGTQLTVRP